MRATAQPRCSVQSLSPNLQATRTPAGILGHATCYRCLAFSKVAFVLPFSVLEEVQPCSKWLFGRKNRSSNETKKKSKGNKRKWTKRAALSFLTFVHFTLCFLWFFFT